MNARLHCQHGSQHSTSFEVSGAETELGRDAALDVSIPLSGVSRRHARITWDGKAFWIEDLRSLNGTFLNGHKVHREKLRHLDVVTLGKTVDLVFEVISTQGSDAAPQVARAALEPTDGGAARELAAGDTTLGRAESCTIVIEDPAVAPHHARVERRRGHLLVRDLGSSSGTYVNGRPVNAAWLRNGDEVSLGGVATFRVVLESDAGTPPPVPRTPPAPARRADETRYEWDAAEEESLARLRQRLLKLQAAGAGPAPAPGEPAAPRPPATGPAAPPRPAAAAAAPPAAPVAASSPPPTAPTQSAPAPPAGASPAAAPLSAPPTPVQRRAMPPRPATPPVAAPPTARLTAPTRPASSPTPAASGPAAPQTATVARPPAAPPAAAPSAPPLADPGAKTVHMRAPQPASPPPRAREAAAPAAKDTGPVQPLRRVRLQAAGVDLVVEHPGTYELGRSPTADLRVEHISVSRQHARLVMSADRSWVTVEDNASANGTYVNGEAIHLPVFLGHGDTVGVGQLELTVVLEAGRGEA